MSAEFDWDLINCERWTPLSQICATAQRVVSMLFAIAPGFYALTSEGFNEKTSEEDPGVAAILWSRARSPYRL
ncbi:hypothetical protein [Actinoplanes sp. N902-109]|uniref:hypothetical protein n=1 Tax=Actinoplanes sp. (strain N902-109) TaxID=649831 RepID=UPI0012F9E22B|nr:hypothetical protein [Actinoplanes sp. N902-109]